MKRIGRRIKREKRKRKRKIERSTKVKKDVPYYFLPSGVDVLLFIKNYFETAH